MVREWKRKPTELATMMAHKPITALSETLEQPTQEFVIQTVGLTKTYAGKEVVRSVDLKVPRNSIFGFLGPNGAGKTTTMKCILGLVRPTSGRVLVFGEDITNPGFDYRRRIGFLSQHPKYYDYMTAREVVQFRSRFFYKGPKELVQAKVDEAIQLVGLEDRADRPIKGFSGGERQRLGIAQATVNNPSLLILDEPAAALDPMGRMAVLKIMEKLRDKSTIFYSTHILDDVQRVSDTVAIMREGQLVAQAPIDDLLSGSRGVYKVELRGDTSTIRPAISSLPWVSSLEQENSFGNAVTWLIQVNDEQQAEENLLPLLVSHKNIKVLSCGFQEQELEDVFLSLVA